MITATLEQQPPGEDPPGRAPPGPAERRPSPPRIPADPDQPGSVIRTLTTQLTELKRRHRDEVNALEQALEAAHGENLELRRRLGHRDTAAPIP